MIRRPLHLLSHSYPCSVAHVSCLQIGRLCVCSLACGQDTDLGSGLWCAQQLQRVIRGDYKIPSRVKISEPCRDLLDRILQVNVGKRITIPEILKHKWCASLPSHLCTLCAAPGVATQAVQ